MATLTKNWQKIDQTYLGSSGGDLHVRIYARYTEQDIANNKSYVEYQARTYFTGNYIYDQQGTLSVNGTGIIKKTESAPTPKNGETYTVTSGAWITHNNNGSKSVSCSAELNFPNWGWSGTASGTADLPTIPRASGIACSSPIIGDTAIVTIDRKSSSFTNTVTYKLGTIERTLAEKTTEITLQIDTSVIADDIYKQIPSDKELSGTIYCTTYNGSTQIGETQSSSFRVYARESDCIPDVSAVVIDTNTNSIAITGDSSKLIKYISKPKVTINATAKNHSTITKYKFNLDGKSINQGGKFYVKPNEYTFDTIENNNLSVDAVDSRGYENPKQVDLLIIDYVMLHLNTLEVGRPEGTSNEIILNADGVWFNDKFNDSHTNTLKVSFEYKESSDDVTEWASGGEIAPTINENRFSFYDYSLGNIFDYNKEYQIRLTVEDTFIKQIEVATASKGQEVIAIGEDKVYVYGELDTNGVLSLDGVPLIWYEEE